MKRIISLIIMSCLFFLGCISDEEYGDYVTPAEQAEIWGKQTIEVFINKDKAYVKNLFNEKMKKSII